MERTTPTENTDIPKPWEDRQITKAAWEKHRDFLMGGAATGHGWRPEAWWLYERNMEPPMPPYKQAAVLLEMGELKGGELERVLGWWRDTYDRAHDIDGPRESHGNWEDIPPALVKKWDAERRKQHKQLARLMPPNVRIGPVR
jgi:hypothetical protein